MLTKENKEKKHAAYAALRDQGFSIKESGVMIGYSPNSVSALFRGPEKQRKSILSTMTPIAKKAIRKTIRGEKVGDADPPKASDVIKACEMVLNRVDPIVQKIESSSVNINLSPDHQAAYLSELVTAIQASGSTQPPPIDVTPDPDPKI